LEDGQKSLTDDRFPNFSTLLKIVDVVLASESSHKGSNDPYIGSPVVAEERMRPGR